MSIQYVHEIISRDYWFNYMYICCNNFVEKIRFCQDIYLYAVVKFNIFH